MPGVPFSSQKSCYHSHKTPFNWRSSRLKNMPPAPLELIIFLYNKTKGFLFTDKRSVIHRRVNITQRIFSIRNYIMANLSLLSGSLIYFIFLTKKCQGINFRTLYRTGSVDALNETYKFRSDSGDFKY